MSKQKLRTGSSLSQEERESMIREYLTGQYSKMDLWKKYTGQDQEHGQLLNWMRDLGYVADNRKCKCVSLRQQTTHALEQPSNDLDTSALQSRIKELEKKLETVQLKAEGYELMIEIAEKELKIPIRKKSDTK